MLQLRLKYGWIREYLAKLDILWPLHKRAFSLKDSIYFYRDTKDTDGESKAASGLGEVYLQMGEFDKATHYHKMDYDISEANHDMEGKVCNYQWYYSYGQNLNLRNQGLFENWSWLLMFRVINHVYWLFQIKG